MKLKIPESVRIAGIEHKIVINEDADNLPPFDRGTYQINIDAGASVDSIRIFQFYNGIIHAIAYHYNVRYIQIEERKIPLTMLYGVVASGLIQVLADNDVELLVKHMMIPNIIEIAGVGYVISYATDLEVSSDGKDIQECAAVIDYRDSMIIIDNKKYGKSYNIFSFWHEVAHGIHFHYGGSQYKDNEEAMNQFAEGFIYLLKHNFDRLFEIEEPNPKPTTSKRPSPKKKK